MRDRKRSHVGDWLRKKLNIPSPRDRVLHVDSEGVTLRDRLFDKRLWQVRWSDVERIVAFKIDAMIVDHICLGFYVTSSSTMWITDEETSGWDTLNHELATRFGVVVEQWLGDVAFPAFATNEIVLWRRSSSVPSCPQTDYRK